MHTFDENTMYNKKLTIEHKEKKCIITLKDIKCKIVDLSHFYSGHADQSGLVQYVLGPKKIKNTFPSSIFLNHGTNESKLAVKEAIEKSAKEQNIQEKRIIIPKGKWYNLNTGEEEIDSAMKPNVGEDESSKLNIEVSKVNLEIKIVVPLEKLDDENLFMLLRGIKNL